MRQRTVSLLRMMRRRKKRSTKTSHSSSNNNNSKRSSSSNKTTTKINGVLLRKRNEAKKMRALSHRKTLKHTQTKAGNISTWSPLPFSFPRALAVTNLTTDTEQTAVI